MRVNFILSVSHLGCLEFLSFNNGKNTQGHRPELMLISKCNLPANGDHFLPITQTVRQGGEFHRRKAAFIRRPHPMNTRLRLPLRSSLFTSTTETILKSRERNHCTASRYTHTFPEASQLPYIWNKSENIPRSTILVPFKSTRGF